MPPKKIKDTISTAAEKANMEMEQQSPPVAMKEKASKRGKKASTSTEESIAAVTETLAANLIVSDPVTVSMVEAAVEEQEQQPPKSFEQESIERLQTIQFSFAQNLSNIKKDFDALKKLTSDLLNREKKNSKKSGGKARSKTPTKSCNISDDFASFLGYPKGETMTSAQVMHALETYVKDHNLLISPEQVAPDQNLKTLLGDEVVESVDLSSMHTSLMKRHTNL